MREQWGFACMTPSGVIVCIGGTADCWRSLTSRTRAGGYCAVALPAGVLASKLPDWGRPSNITNALLIANAVIALRAFCCSAPSVPVYDSKRLSFDHDGTSKITLGRGGSGSSSVSPSI